MSGGPVGGRTGDALAGSSCANTPVFSFEGTALRARLLDVHDGDTATVAAEVYPGRVCQLSLRLAGIDAPEMASETVGAEVARCRLLQLLTGLEVDGATTHLTRGQMRALLQRGVHLVHVACGENDKYGRVLARVSREEGGRHAGDVLLEEGLVNPYGGGTKLAFKKQGA